MTPDLKKMADYKMDEFMDHFPKECGFSKGCYTCKEGAYEFAREVAEAVLDEAIKRVFAYPNGDKMDDFSLGRRVGYAEALPALKALKREILGEEKKS